MNFPVTFKSLWEQIFITLNNKEISEAQDVERECDLLCFGLNLA